MQRLEKFPFNQTKVVKLISFDTNHNPLRGDTLNSSLVTKSLTLNAIQINELTTILYNFNYTDKKDKSPVLTECYFPRHAILFFDADEKLMAYMEYCFQCSGHMSSDSLVEMGQFCKGKYDLIEAFFNKQGITTDIPPIKEQILLR